MRERPTQATVAYFEGRKFMVGEEVHTISTMEATAIVNYLYENDYVDDKGNIQQSYHEDLRTDSLAPMGKKLAPISEQVHKLVQGIFDPTALADMIEDANESAEAVNDHLNDNASKEEFKRLWEEINHRYVYTVHYDSEELIQKAVASINKNLRVTELKYVVTTGEQGTDDLDFTGDQHTRTQAMKEVSTSDVPYDLVGEIAKGATLTRRTVVRILKSGSPCIPVIRNGISNICIPPTIDVIRRKNIIGRSKGTVIFHVHCHSLAPSITADSYKEGEIPVMAAINKINVCPHHIHH